MDRLVIDTSMWIEAFRSGCDPATADTVKALIRSDRVLLPGIIKAELLRGARNQAEFDRLKELLEALAPLPLPESFWDELAAFSFSLFRKGLTIPLVDTAIALLCIRHRLPLFHRDRHFDLIAEVTELKIFPVVTTP
jgi:predicted nucleic acid-binding protein